MAKDYRLRLLNFLKEHYPDKVNISHLLKDYLSETNSSRPYFKNILEKLKKDGFVLFGDEVIDSIIRASGQTYNDNNIMVCLTHTGLDEISRIEKQEYDLRNAERVYKTYPLTRFMAIAGFVISLILLILKVAEEMGWLSIKH